MDIEVVKKYYSELSDNEIKRIAKSDAKGMVPEAIEILKNEIIRRKINPLLIEEIIEQNISYPLQPTDKAEVKYSEKELNEYVAILRTLPCPLCNSSEKKLNAIYLYAVKSPIIYIKCSVELLIACADCMNKKNIKSILLTIGLGFLGVPFNLIFIYRNIMERKQIKLEKPNKLMIEFTQKNMYEIQKNKSESKSLKKIIARTFPFKHTWLYGGLGIGEQYIGKTRTSSIRSPFSKARL
jgi:hypothetical protein